jgi:hypothetical protein
MSDGCCVSGKEHEIARFILQHVGVSQWHRRLAGVETVSAPAAGRRCHFDIVCSQSIT